MTPELAALIISLASILIAIYSWHKSRVIYKVERCVIRQVRGKRDDEHTLEPTKLNSMLKSGKYTIVTTYNRRADGDTEAILGQVKK